METVLTLYASLYCFLRNKRIATTSPTFLRKIDSRLRVLTLSAMLCRDGLAKPKLYILYILQYVHFVDDMTLVSHFLHLFDDVLASGISSDDELEVNACGNPTSRAL